MSRYYLPAVKLLALEIITLAFRDLTIEDKIKGRSKRIIAHKKQSADIFLKSDWGMLCANLAGIEDLKELYKKNQNGIKLNHFEICRCTRTTRKFYRKRRVKE